MGRTRRAIESLMELHPEEATLADQAGRAGERIPVADLEIGDRILVRPGERIAADGEVDEGRSQADQSTITGESLPVPKNPGDEVFAGLPNLVVVQPACRTNGLARRHARSVSARAGPVLPGATPHGHRADALARPRTLAAV
jgi:magnesium-transporting ATPase (P-type)